MTDYYTYTPNPVNIGPGNYFNLTYNAFEILRPIGIFTLYDSQIPPNQLSTYDPNSTFDKGTGLFNPVAMVFDSSGNLYALCDLTNVPNVNISTSFCVVKLNSTATSGDILIYGTHAQVSSYGKPDDITIDVSNNIYLSFGLTGKIAKYNSSGVEQNGQSGKPFLTGISKPSNITCDISGNLYVIFVASVTNPDSVNKYDNTGTKVSGFTITSSSGETVFDICCNNDGLLYVGTYTGNQHNDVYSYNNATGGSKTKVITQLEQTGANGIGKATSLIFDKSRYLYLASNSNSNTNHNFIKIDTNSSIPYTTSVSSAQSFSPDINSSAIAYNINNANHLYTLINPYIPTGKTYTTSGTTIYSLTLPTNLSGNTVTESIYYDSSGNINYPQFIVFDNVGAFYVSDMIGKVFKITTSGVISTFLSNLDSPSGIVIHNNILYVATVSTTTDSKIYSCPISTPNTPTLFLTINQSHNVEGLAVDNAGTYMFICAEKSSNDKARIFTTLISNPQTNLDFIAEDGTHDIYYGCAFDKSGNLYAALNYGYTSQGSIMKWSPPFFSTPKPVGTLYFNTYQDPSGVTRNLVNPTGIVFDALGNLYVACTDANGNGIVVQNNLTSGSTTLFAQSSNLINNPIGIALNVLGNFPTGNLYIACQNNSRIVQSATHNIIFTHIPASPHILQGLNSLNIEDPYNLIGIYVNGNCYRKGTRILTYNGYKKIEDLKPKDNIVTVSKISNINNELFFIEKENGKNIFKTELKPIIGIGSFKVPKTDENTAPICIKKDAIKENCPENDLFLSPDHIVLFPEKLDKAKNFINKTNEKKTVYQDFLLMNIEYYHIELEEHSLIVAENMFAETYVTGGDKSMFEEWKTIKN